MNYYISFKLCNIFVTLYNCSFCSTQVLCVEQIEHSEFPTHTFFIFYFLFLLLTYMIYFILNIIFIVLNLFLLKSQFEGIF